MSDSPKILLLIEDDPLMLRMYKKVFTMEGYQVDLASSGEEGLEKAKEQKPQLILLDIMMPKMDGFEVLSHLKDDPSTRDIPVIVLTNLAGAQDAERAIAMGAVKYVIKSEHDPKGVVSIAREVLGDNGKAGSNDSPNSDKSEGEASVN